MFVSFSSSFAHCAFEPARGFVGADLFMCEHLARNFAAVKPLATTVALVCFSPRHGVFCVSFFRSSLVRAESGCCALCGSECVFCFRC